MVDTVTPIKALDEQEQAVFFYARSRTRSFREPSNGLFKTHRFTGAITIPIATIVTNDVFPDLDRVITLSTEIEISGASASGIVWEFGSSTQGAKLAIDSGSIFLSAGDVSGNGGVDGSVSIAALGITEARMLLTVAINPGKGQARLWIDDQVALRLDSVSGMLNNSWTDSEDGALLSAQSGTSTQRGQTINGAPVDFFGVRPLDVFQSQIPRQFDT